MKRTSSTKEQKATALLEAQHRKVEALFKRLESKRSDHRAVLQELACDLAAHMKIEQDLFYPAVRKVEEDLVLESFEEHALAETALKRLLSVDPEDPTFAAKVTVLEELIQHHVEDEEEQLFPKVNERLDAATNQELGRKMKAVFERAVEQGYEAVLPRGPKTSADSAERRVLQSVNGAVR